MKNYVPLFGYVAFPKMAESKISSSYADEEALRDKHCERSVRKFGWMTMEWGEEEPIRNCYKKYLDTICNQGELKCGKIHANGEGGKIRASGEGSRSRK